MVLMVLLVGTALTAMAFYLADSAHVQTDQAAWYAERFNGAQGGILEGQRWLDEQLQKGIPPRWDGTGDNDLTAAKIAAFRAANPGKLSEDLLDLAAHVPLAAVPGMTRRVQILDLGYEALVPFAPGMPPALAGMLPEEGALDQGGDYQGSNVGASAVEKQDRRLFYLVRSVASRDEGGATILELALRQPVW